MNEPFEGPCLKKRRTNAAENKTGLDADTVRFLIGKNRIPVMASRKRLSSTSAYFAAMFNVQHFQEGLQDEITLHVPPFSSGICVARLLVADFIVEEPGTLPVSKSYHTNKSNVLSVYAAADYFQMDTLVEACVGFIIQHGVSAASCLRLLQFSMQRSHAHLKRRVGEIVGTMFPVIRKTPRFASLNVEELLVILRQPFLVVASEMDVFESLSCWYQKNRKLDAHVLEVTLCEIRWSVLSFEERQRCHGVLKDIFPRHRHVIGAFFDTLYVGLPLPRNRNRHQCLYITVSERALAEFDLRTRAVRVDTWPYSVNRHFNNDSAMHHMESDTRTLNGNIYAMVTHRKTNEHITWRKMKRRRVAGPIFRLEDDTTRPEEVFCCFDVTPADYSDDDYDFVSTVIGSMHYELPGDGSFRGHAIDARAEDVDTDGNLASTDLSDPPFARILERNGEYATMLVDGGGNIFAYTGRRLYEYNTRGDFWTMRSPPRINRMQPALVELDGYLYVTGGLTIWQTNPLPECGNGDEPLIRDNAVFLERVRLRSCERLDLRSGDSVWQPVGDMTCPRYGHRLCVVDGRLVAVGGLSGDGTNGSLMEIYDAENNQWFSCNFCDLPGMQTMKCFSHTNLFVAEVACYP
ncbi:uncharacterized protein LOC129597232 [Paramacrobiotus metropolitanus]|uniref:uncharacterized protein LOC129597232 n=1 Tax=Paramacrobiotus metropolitanus TaxID=2943436 RepID=UPI0024462A7E|nr:uncharacterized protein LOC129597232 [Paramacrobiotus metropolitanus]